MIESKHSLSNRKIYGMSLLGGVRRDIKPETYDDIRPVPDNIEAEQGRGYPRLFLAAAP